jgi:hypothetical protein
MARVTVLTINHPLNLQISTHTAHYTSHNIPLPVLEEGEAKMPGVDLDLALVKTMP